MKGKRVLITVLLVSFAIVSLVYPRLASAQEPERDQNSTDGAEQVVATPAARTFRDWVGGIQSIVTIIAIAAGGYLAWRNLHIFRTREPHVTISHEISHRPIGVQYIHIAVIATLRNSSRVNVEFHDGSFTLQQVAPSSDEEIEELYADVFAEGQETYLQWRTLEDVRRIWGEDALAVEPGESETETYEFILARHIESVAITTFFYNSRVLGKVPENVDPRNAPRRKRKFLRWLEVRGPQGWGRTTIYDIMLGNEAVGAVADEGNETHANQEENRNNP